MQQLPDTHTQATAGADGRELDDAELIRASLDVPELFGGIFDRHHDRVERYARARLGPGAGDDVVADTFAEAFRIRDRFDPTRGRACLPWLLGIATRMIDRRRAAQRRWLAHPPARIAGADDETADAVDRVAAELLAPWLAAALAKLRARDRTTLLLHVAGELSIEQVAHALDIPVGTVKSRINRARRILAAHLEAHR